MIQARLRMSHPQHVVDADFGHNGAQETRGGPIAYGHSPQATVGSAIDDNFALGRNLLVNEVLRGRDRVVKGVSLLQKAALLVPRVTDDLLQLLIG